MKESNWDKHWSALEKKGMLSGIAEAYRKLVIAPTVGYYCDRHFKKKGKFVDAGCGTGQASQNVSKAERNLIGVDVSNVPFEKAKQLGLYSSLICADINKMPFPNNSLQGIWNVGVMEHMPPKEIENVLNEFYRVLLPGAYCIMFWPPRHSIYSFFIKPFEKAMRLLRIKKFRLYPEEITNFGSKAEMRDFVLRHGKFEECKVFNSFKDLFTHYAVVCRKMPKSKK